MKKVRFIILTVVLLIIAFYLSIHIANNHIAETMKQKLLDCSLPAGTQLLESESFAGKMSGNGNGMQWYGIILVKSSQDETALYEWFNGMMNDDADESLMVFEQNSPEIFDAGNKTFKMYTGEEGCYQIRLVKESLVGFEQSFWESILNCDIRAH